jgi:hypothetical protein
MTMQQITNEAATLGITPELMELLYEAFRAGVTEGVQDAAVTLADNGEESAAELLATNWNFEIA